jgi:hypothetical protein
MLASMIDWRHEVIITVDDQTGEVLGVADWVREGPGAEKQSVQGNGWRYKLRMLTTQP